MSGTSGRSHASPWWLPSLRWRPSVRVLMLVVWLVGAVSAAWLFFTAPDYGAAPGIAEVIEYSLAPLEPERVLAVAVVAGQAVHKGDPLVVFDPAPMTRELEVLAAELRKAQADLEAARVALQTRQTQDRGFEAGVDPAEVGVLQARVTHEQDQAELEGVKARIAWWDGLVEAKVAGTMQLQDLRARAEVLERRLKVDEESVATWEARLDAARRRLEAWGTGGGSDVDDSLEPRLAPLRAAVDLARVRLAQLESRRAGLTLTAPADGVVHRAALQPGEIATPTSPALIIRATPPRRILAYITDAQLRRIMIGTKATVWPHDGSLSKLVGHVVGLGAGMVPFPQHLQTNQNWRVMWGEEVVVELDQEAHIVPGQVFDVKFEHETAGLAKPGTAGRAGESGGDGAATDGPQLATVPAALAGKSSLEPSGLTWISEWERFLVVSDDTGRKETDDHPPWLFTLDKAGAFDEKPVVVEGLKQVNDLESITRAPDGIVWALSSQSVSKRGHRPESRTLLVRLQVGGRHVVATGFVSLAEALSKLDDEALASLGLVGKDPAFVRGVADFDRLLNIEGMTADGDGLLLGLKRPLGPADKAIVWRLKDPAKLVESGELEPGQLGTWGTVALTAGPGGAEVAAGISELLRLPDGGLAILAVALSKEPDAKKQSALWTVAGASGGAMSATKIRDFVGVAAEGIAIGPDPERLWLVFDRNTETPMWMDVPLPK